MFLTMRWGHDKSLLSAYMVTLLNAMDLHYGSPSKDFIRKVLTSWDETIYRSLGTFILN